MKSAETIEQLRAELDQDFAFIVLNHEKNRVMTARVEANGSDDEYEYAALGYTLHNLYNAFESYFLRVAKFFENNIDGAEWHRSLVERMTLTIQGVRPALFDLSFASRVEELMRFRHLFRNLYKTPLVSRKVLLVNEDAANLPDAFAPYHEVFDRFLLELKAQIVSG